MKLYKIKNRKWFRLLKSWIDKFIKAEYLLVASTEKVITISEKGANIFEKKKLDIRGEEPPLTISVNRKDTSGSGVSEYVKMELEEIKPEILLTNENQLLRFIVKGLIFDQQT